MAMELVIALLLTWCGWRLLQRDAEQLSRILLC